jgi:hypothetical protein
LCYKCVVLVLVLFLSYRSFSQLSLKYGIVEAGVSISPSNLLGDLGGNAGKGGSLLKDNNISNTKLLISGHFTLLATEWYGIRFAASYGTIAGDDALIKGKGGDEESRIARNLNFRSKIFELYGAVEFYPTVFLESDPSEHKHKIRPYLVGGVGAFHFNPQGYDEVTGTWVGLKQLHTEGEGFPEYPNRKNYKLKQFNIPVGLGVKYFLNETMSISAEMLLRKTFTDYLDDVSTTYIDKDLFYKHLSPERAILAARMYDKSVGSANRNAGDMRGNSSNKDSYYSAGFKISFILGSNKNLRYTRCPVMRI